MSLRCFYLHYVRHQRQNSLRLRRGTLIALGGLIFSASCSAFNRPVIIVTATPSATIGQPIRATVSTPATHNPVVAALSTNTTPTPRAPAIIMPTRTPTSSPAAPSELPLSPLPITPTQAATLLDPPTVTTIITSAVTTAAVSVPTAASSAQDTLDQANAALRNGDDTSAAMLFGRLLAQPDPPLPGTLQTAAEFGLGVAALRGGDNAGAITALSRFLTDYPTDARAAFAYFLRGDAEKASAQWLPAIADYQAFMKIQPGLLDSYAWERTGDVQVQLANTSEALSAYKQASQGSNRSLIPLLQIREKTATAYLNANDVPDAVAIYDSIVQVAQLPDYRAEMAFDAAKALLGSGDATAYTRLQAIALQYPTTRYAYQAVQALIANGKAVDPYLHGQISFAAQDYGDAAQALTAYLVQTAVPVPNAYVILCQSYAEAGNVSAAQATYQALVDRFPASPLIGQAALAQGRALVVAGKTADGIAKYQAFVDQHPTLPEAAEALWRIGYWYSAGGDTAHAQATFEALGQRYPGSSWAQDALSRAGMAAYNLGDLAEAQRLFSLLAAAGSGDLRAAGALWLGRLYQIQHNDPLARQAYRQAQAADANDPEGYYSQRATDLLAGHGPFVPPAHLDWTFNDAAHLTEADRWLRATFPTLTQPGALWPLANKLASDPQMQRGDALWAIADYDGADAEYSGLRDSHAADPLALYQLAGYFNRIGLYRQTIATAQLLIDLSQQPIAAIPRYVAALCYPIAYSDLILPAAHTAGVDPLFVFSVIRQESLFEPSATSYAAAQGLMQIIPDTGTYIAGELNWPNYQNSDLFRPYVNVTFGISYLKEQLATFNGNPYAALAAYNAGPTNSRQWYTISNGDPDLFLQAIDIDQTQTYVRRIYLQYNAYAIIYSAK